MQQPLQAEQILRTSNLLARIRICQHKVTEGKLSADILANLMDKGL